MDKQRIMELAQELASVPDTDTGYAKHYILDDIENELDAKPVMPKVFDEWYKDTCELKQKCPSIGINLLYGLANVYVDSFDAEKGWEDLAGWINGDIEKYQKCIDAIRYGYEAEE